jgi:GNAT superfamily N-acetyltransferase
MEKRQMIKIIHAQTKDAGLLKDICLQSKSYWNYPEEWMEQFARSPIITPTTIHTDLVYKACNGSDTLGWYRLSLNPPAAELEDLWVLPVAIGNGLGRALFEHMLSRAKNNGVQTIELDADPHAVPFYEHMGCQVTGQSLSEWGRYIPHMRYKLFQ